MIEIEFGTTLPPLKTWERLTQNEHLHVWWAPGIVLEPVKKGRFTEPWKDETGQARVATGLVTAFEPPRRLQMNYQQQSWPAPTRIEFLLTADGQDGTRVSLQHSGWEALPDEVQRRKEFDAHTRLWSSRIDNFTRYCAEKK